MCPFKRHFLITHVQKCIIVRRSYETQKKIPCKRHINYFLNPKKNPKKSLFKVSFIKRKFEKHSLKKLDKLKYQTN